MSVILEFTVAGTGFALGDVLSGSPDMHLELERIVPTGTQVMPFVWATGQGQEAFAERVRNHPRVEEFVTLDRQDDSGLYRIDWEDPPADLIEGIVRSEATVLEARGDGEWTFRLRFADAEDLSAFHEYCTRRDIDIFVVRTYGFGEDLDDPREFDLTEEQREALVLALRRGYFATPSETTLEALADELGISRQALSNRIRRGNERVLRQVLRQAVGDEG